MKKKLTREIFLYLIFGVFTTFINILTYSLLYYKLNVANTLANIVSWAISVLFAYITNRIWVFKSKNKNIFYEIATFFLCRGITGILDVAIMYLFVDMLSFEGGIMKIVSNVIVIILNYIFSKTVIFEKER